MFKGIFNKVKIRFVDGQIVRRIYLFGIPLIEYKKVDGKLRFSKVKTEHPDNADQRVFYLKVNRVHQTSFNCIQQWLDIADKLNAFCYFVCDNKQMEYEIFNSKSPCYFYPGVGFQFIKSDRVTLKTQISTILSNVERYKLWQRIAYSMMTPFTHALKNGYKHSYNIDADDILLMGDPRLIAQAFIEMENQAEKHDIDCFNLDMFVSKSFGAHWSFGVVYMRAPQKCLDVMKKNLDWRSKSDLHKKFKINYLDTFNFNVDWFFTYLRDSRQLNLKTFCVNNLLICHMPDIAITRHWAFVFQWKNDNIYFPLLDHLYNDKKWATIPIANGIFSIDVGLTPKSYVDFVNHMYWTDYSFENKMLSIANERGLLAKNVYYDYFTTPNPRGYPNLASGNNSSCEVK